MSQSAGSLEGGATIAVVSVTLVLTAIEYDSLSVLNVVEVEANEEVSVEIEHG